MSDVETIWRAGLPPVTHEWAIIPEGEPQACDCYQEVGSLPKRKHPWKPIPVEVINPHAGQNALRATIPCWSSSNKVLVLRDEAMSDGSESPL